MHTLGRTLIYTKYGLWTKQIKMTGQRKTGKNAPCEWVKLPSNSGTLPRSLPVCLCIHAVLFSLLIEHFACFTTLIFVEVLSCRAEGPGPLSLTTGLVAGIQRFMAATQPRSLNGNPSPLQAVAGRGHPRSKISTLHELFLGQSRNQCSEPEVHFTLPCCNKGQQWPHRIQGFLQRRGCPPGAHKYASQPGLQRQNSVGL